jgi:hypothetical protein
MIKSKLLTKGESIQNMRANIKKFIYIALIIWTVIVVFIVYKNIEFSFVFQFVVGYVIFLLLTCLYFTITIFLNIRKLKWSTIRKMLLKFIIGSFAIWALNVLFIYLTKGELRIMDKIFGSIILSFGLTFGELIFKKKNSD